jgi:hypothetical protein
MVPDDASPVKRGDGRVAGIGLVHRRLLPAAFVSGILLAACALPSYSVELRVANDSDADIVVMASEAGLPPVMQFSQPIAARTTQTISFYPDQTAFTLSVNGETIGYWKCWPADGHSIDYSVHVQSDGTVQVLEASPTADCST